MFGLLSEGGGESGLVLGDRVCRSWGVGRTWGLDAGYVS